MVPFRRTTVFSHRNVGYFCNICNTHSNKYGRKCWREYKHGVDDRKPAEQFTTVERNQNRATKQAFYRRNVFWEVVARRIRGGENSHIAIQKIRQAYGDTTSVTKVLKAMAKDKKMEGILI